MINLLPFLFQKVSSRIYRQEESASLVTEFKNYLLVELLPEEIGIAAEDRLYPLKPKNPI